MSLVHLWDAMRILLIYLTLILLGSSALADERTACNPEKILAIILQNPHTSERLKSLLNQTVAQNPGKSKREILAIFRERKRSFGESLHRQAEAYAKEHCGKRPTPEQHVTPQR